jgi:ankyrin repeat protein
MRLKISLTSLFQQYLEAASLPPWDIQKSIFSAMELDADRTPKASAGKLYFDLSLCYLTGFGTVRDINKMLESMTHSAMSGFPLALKVLMRLHAACSRQSPIESLPDSSGVSEVIRIESVSASHHEYYTRRIQLYNSAAQISAMSQPFRIVDGDGQDVSLFQGTLEDLKQFAILNKESVKVWQIVVPDTNLLLGTCSFLHFASFFGQNDLVEMLLDRGSNINAITKDGRTPLYFACRGGKTETIYYLLHRGANASINDNFDISPLHWMIMVPDAVEDICRKLLLSGAKVNILSSSRILIPEHFLTLLGTPLHWAVSTCHKSLIQALLTIGADVDGLDNSWTPIQLAASLHLYEEIDLFLQYNASREDNSRRSPFFELSGRLPIQRWLIHGDQHAQALKMTVLTLLNYGISIENPDMDGLTPLVHCLVTEASDTDIEIADVFIEHGANPHRRIGGYPVLHWAVIGSQPSPRTIDTLKLLLKRNVDINSVADEDHDGYTALHCAAEVNHLSAAEFLLSEGLDARARTLSGATPMHIAVQKNGSVELLKTLVDWGGDIDDVEDQCQLTVFGACLETPTTDASVIDFLVEQSNSVVVSKNNRTILHLAAAQGSKVNGRFLLSVLLTHKKIRESINTVDSNGWSALHMAALGVDVYSTFVLIDAGADVTMRTSDSGLSAWDIVDLNMREPSQSNDEEEEAADDKMGMRGQMIKDRLEEALEKRGVGLID